MSDTQTAPPPPRYVQPPVTCCTIDLRFEEWQDPGTGIVHRHYVAEVTDLSSGSPETCSVRSLEISPEGPFRGHFLGVLGQAVQALGEKAVAAFENAPGPTIILPDTATPEPKKIIVQAYPDL